MGAGEAVDFSRLLNVEIIASRIKKGFKQGNVKGVVQLLNSVAKLHVEVLTLIDGVALQSITMEVCKLVDRGNVEEAVKLMELLSGFQFSVRPVVDPNDMIRKCVDRRKPHIVVRYASLLPHVEILFCTIIKDFEKKGDLVSALTVYEAIKQKLTGHNMFIYRSIIDVCGLCVDSFRSRLIYEGHRTVATGRVEQGTIKVGEEVEILSLMQGGPLETTVTGVEMFKKILDHGEAGDNVGLLLHGLKREDIQRG